MQYLRKYRFEFIGGNKLQEFCSALVWLKLKKKKKKVWMQGHCTGKCDWRQTKNSPVTNCLTFFSIWRSRHFNLRWLSFIIRISSVCEIFATAIYLKYYRFNRAVQFLYDQYKQPICCCLDVGLTLWSQNFSIMNPPVVQLLHQLNEHRCSRRQQTSGACRRLI